jgi:type IV pilus assembly protein PilM
MRLRRWSVLFRVGLQAWLARLRPAPQGPIGLDLAAERLNLVQFTFRPDGPALQAAASLPYPQPREELLAQPRVLADFVRRALRQHGFKGRCIVSSLDPAELRFFPVTFGVAPGQDEGGALASELRARLGAELDGAVVDYLPIRSHDAGDDQEAGRAQRDALVVVAPAECVLQRAALLEGVGLELQALDVGPAAVARLIAQMNAAGICDGSDSKGSGSAEARPTHPNTLVINFGRQRCHLSVVWGRRLMLDRQIEFSMEALLERVMRALGVDRGTADRLLQDKGLLAQGELPRGDEDSPAPADAAMARTLAEILRPEIDTLVAEVNKTLIYIASRSRGRSVDRVYLLGSFGRIPGADRLLHSRLALPVAALNPFRRLRQGASREMLARLLPIAGLALAAGLALRGGPSGGRGRDIDLLPAAHLQRRARLQLLRGAGLVTVGLLAAAGLARLGLELGIARERPQVQRMQQEAAAASVLRSELAGLMQRREAAEARLQSLQALRRTADWQQALQGIDAAFRPGMWFEQMRFAQTLERAQGAATLAAAPAAALPVPAAAGSASVPVWPTRQTLEIRGHALDHAGVMTFVRQLGEQPALRSPRLVDSTARRQAGGEMIDFTVSAQVDAAAGRAP